jgi:thymidylate kinase
MYIFLEILNVLVWYFIFVFPRVKREKIVIADRFAPDSIVSLNSISDRFNQVFERILLGLCKDTAAVYVYAQPQTLLQRKISENLSETYLRYTVKLYNDVAKYIASIAREFVIIDTTRSTKQHSVDLIFGIVKKHV